MSHLWRIFRVVLLAERAALARGAALGLAVLLAGAALLALSGWFIVAAATAGLAGAGVVFDVFRPSAMVRLLALGRTAARYGERLLTHDATLRALAAIRVRLLARLVRAPYPRIERLRGSLALNALTADVDALDGVTLRLVLPVLAGLAAHLLVAPVLAWLTVPSVAAWLIGVHLLGGGLVLAVGMRAAAAPARRAERAAQAFRARALDLIRARADLAVAGRLAAQRMHALEADRRRWVERQRLDRIERRAGLTCQALTLLGAGGALVLGIGLVEVGALSPAQAAIGPFAALALAETLTPLRRAVAEYGRMADAARRVAPDLVPAQVAAAPSPAPAGAGGPLLALRGVCFRRVGAARPVITGLDLELRAGQTVALTGPSGAGKSTALAICAGLLAPERGTVLLDGRALREWDETGLRAGLTLVPQRSALMRGSLREALRLAAPGATDAEMRAALEVVALWPAVAGRGGLDLLLGDRGAGLSGGEARRLALARAVLRRPRVLLLDEPTDGLDTDTAARLLQGLRSALPKAGILLAAHKPVELGWADCRRPL